MGSIVFVFIFVWVLHKKKKLRNYRETETQIYSGLVQVYLNIKVVLNWQTWNIDLKM